MTTITIDRAVVEQALEACEQYTAKELTVGQRYTNEGQQLLDAITALRAALAEQPAEQEPVAWMCSNNELMHMGYQRFAATPGGDWNIPVYAAPSPAKPAERVPLTDEEIKYATLEAANHLIDHIYEYGVNSEGVSHRIYKFARAIEAKILEQFK